MKTNFFTNKENAPKKKGIGMTGMCRWVIGLMAMLLLGAGNVNAQVVVWTGAVNVAAGGTYLLEEDQTWDSFTISSTAVTNIYIAPNVTITVLGNFSIPVNQTKRVIIGTGGQLIVGGNLTMDVGESNGIYGANACTIDVKGDLLMNANANSTCFLRVPNGTVKIGGNFRITGSTGAAGAVTASGTFPGMPATTSGVDIGTLDMSEDKDVNAARAITYWTAANANTKTVGNFIQSPYSSASYTVNTAVNRITITNSYSENCNSVNLNAANTPFTVAGGATTWKGLFSNNCNPEITVTGTLSPFTTCPAYPSAEQSFTVSGRNLVDAISGNITIELAGYEFSKTSGSGYVPVLTLDQTGGRVNATPVYMRLAENGIAGSSGNYSDDILLTTDNGSGGVTTKPFAVSGTVSNVSYVNVYSSSITNFNYNTANTAPAPQSFDVEGVCWSSNILVEAPVGYQVSTSSGSGFGSSVTLPSTGGKVYIRLMPDELRSDNTYTGYVVVSSTGIEHDRFQVSGVITGRTLYVNLDRVTVDWDSNIWRTVDCNGAVGNNRPTRYDNIELCNGSNRDVTINIPAGTVAECRNLLSQTNSNNTARTLGINGTLNVFGNFEYNTGTNAQGSFITGSGTLKVAGNFNFGLRNGTIANTIVIELTGTSPQTITLGKPITIGTFRQSRTYSTPYTLNGFTSTGTPIRVNFTTYDQNCNPICLASPIANPQTTWINTPAPFTGATFATARINDPSILSASITVGAETSVRAADGTADVCIGGTGTVLLTATPNANPNKAITSPTYQWYKVGTGAIGGATNATYNAPYPGTYYAICNAGNNGSCEKETYRIELVEIPCGPIINVSCSKTPLDVYTSEKPYSPDKLGEISISGTNLDDVSYIIITPPTSGDEDYINLVGSGVTWVTSPATGWKVPKSSLPVSIDVILRNDAPVGSLSATFAAGNYLLYTSVDVLFGGTKTINPCATVFEAEVREFSADLDCSSPFTLTSIVGGDSDPVTFNVTIGNLPDDVIVSLTGGQENYFALIPPSGLSLEGDGSIILSGKDTYEIGIYLLGDDDPGFPVAAGISVKLDNSLIELLNTCVFNARYIGEPFISVICETAKPFTGVFDVAGSVSPTSQILDVKGYIDLEGVVGTPLFSVKLENSDKTNNPFSYSIYKAIDVDVDGVVSGKIEVFFDASGLATGSNPTAELTVSVVDEDELDMDSSLDPCNLTSVIIPFKLNSLDIGTDSYCVGQKITLSANVTAVDPSALTYTYTITEEGEGVISTGTSNSFTVPYGTTGKLTFRVDVSNGTSTYDDYAEIEDIEIAAAGCPTVTLSTANPPAFCPGTQVTINAWISDVCPSPHSSCIFTYEWDKEGTPIPSATTGSLLVSNSAAVTDAGTYTVIVKWNNQEVNRQSYTLSSQVAKATPDAPLLGGAAKVCAGEKITIPITNYDASMTYAWSIDNGTTTATAGNVNSYDLSYVAGISSYTITVTATDVCTKTAQTVKVIRETNPDECCTETIIINNFGFGTGNQSNYGNENTYITVSTAYTSSEFGASNTDDATGNYVAVYNTGIQNYATFKITDGITGTNQNYQNANTIADQGRYYLYCSGNSGNNTRIVDMFRITVPSNVVESDAKYALSLNAANVSTGTSTLDIYVGGIKITTSALSQGATSFTPLSTSLDGNALISGIGVSIMGVTGPSAIRAAIDDIHLVKICPPTFGILTNGSICDEEEITLSFNENTEGATTYQWQIHDGEDFVNVSGPNGSGTISTLNPATLPIGKVTADVTYKLIVQYPASPYVSAEKKITLFAPTTLTWQGITSDWDDEDNWKVKGASFVPRVCDNVIISAASNLPILGTPAVPVNVECAKITFEPNTSIGQIQNLTYTEAKVQMEVEATRVKTGEVPRWYLLTPALKGTVSGDYRPASILTPTPLIPVPYARYFYVEDGVASWTNAMPATDVSFAPGQGFVYRASYLDVPGNHGIGEDKGIKVNLPITFNGSDGRFITEVSGVTPFDANDAYALNVSLNNYSSSVDGETDAVYKSNEYIVVGNPFMSHLNLKKFLTHNNIELGVITGADLKIFSNGAFTSTQLAPAGEVWAAPMQAFLVKPAESLLGETSLTLEITKDMLETSTNVNFKLRGLTEPENTLRIRVTQGGYTSGEALVIAKDGASNGFDPDEDATKIFSAELSLEVSTLIEGKACDVNKIDRSALDGLSVPINIKSTKAGVITLEIDGAVGFMAADNIYLYDNLTQKSTSLLEQGTFLIAKDEAGDINGRFFLQFVREESEEPIITDIDNSSALSSLYIGARQGNVVVQTRDEEILQVIVYDVTGRKVIEAANVNSTAYTQALPAPAAYLVKVVTNKQVKIGKIAVK